MDAAAFKDSPSGRLVWAQRRNRVYHADELLRAIQDPIVMDGGHHTT
ncbi:MAG TPA: hypothetical protein GX714_00670 [Chloroflexi bacterium]|nr:hypothetical protein [Chloroflexota bacterium]